MPLAPTLYVFPVEAVTTIESNLNSLRVAPSGKVKSIVCCPITFGRIAKVKVNVPVSPIFYEIVGSPVNDVNEFVKVKAEVKFWSEFGS